MNRNILHWFFCFAVCACPNRVESAIIELSVQTYADHPDGSNFGDSDQENRTAQVAAHASAASAVAGMGQLGNDVYTFKSQAVADSSAGVLPDSSGFLLSRAAVSASPKLRFPNDPAVATTTSSIVLDAPPGAVSLIASSFGGQPNRSFVSVRDGNAWILHEMSLALGRFGGNTSGAASYAAVWATRMSPSGAALYPGLDEDSPLPPTTTNTGQVDDGEDDPVDLPAEITGAFLVNPQVFIAPVRGGYGTVNPIFFSAEEPLASSGAAGALTAAGEGQTLGYYFATSDDGLPFASIRLADLAPEQTYTAHFSGVTRSVQGGEVIDFSGIVPEGISSFFLSGVAGHDGAGIPHVFAASFKGEGAADFYVVAVQVPAPSAAVLLLAALPTLLACARFRFTARIVTSRKR